GGGMDAFVAKFTTAGLRSWCAYFGGPNSEQAYGAAAVGSDVFIAGNTTSPSQIAVGASIHQATRQGPKDGYVARLSGANGAVQWATYYGGPSEETEGAVATGPDGHAYLVGNTTSTSMISTAGAWHPTLLGSSDGYLAKLNGTTGARLWGTYIGGNATDGVFDVAVNCAGNVFTVGSTSSVSGFAAPGNVHQSSYGGGASDGFIARFTATGVFNWATYYGGPGGDLLYDVTIGGDARLFIGGSTGSTTGTAIATPGSSHPTFLGGVSDGFLASFTSAGVRNWGTYYGGEGNDRVNAVFQGGNRLYSTGETYSNTIISTLNSEPGGPGLPDAFLGCHSADLTTTCLGIDEPSGMTTSGSTAEHAETRIVPYPNPATSWATLYGASAKGLIAIEICDAQGQLRSSWTGPDANKEDGGGGVRIDLSSLHPGLYVVQLIYADESRTSTRLMVQP
ncbi:MAG: T9SS type A sorting domain-containing protein, partial [Flavobacteriales bacterium]|nr:T9SS type A sorting domain-containing protein [Flavobacteriales bacterium]